MKRLLTVSAAIGLLLIAGACSKDNPSSSSPTVSAPTPVSPAVGATVKYTDQPLTLVATNATTTGSTALTYTFEVSSDVSFASRRR